MLSRTAAGGCARSDDWAGWPETEEETLNTKRSLAVLLALGVATLGAACGASSKTDSTDTGGNATPAASDTTATEAPATTAAPAIKVGLATDQGGLNDKGFNQLAAEGAKKAEAELGIELEIKESKTENDYVPNMTYFCQGGKQLVIAIGFLMANAVAEVAKQCPDTKFAIIDNSVQGDPINAAPNVTGLLFKEQETGYLVGFLSGLINKESGFKGVNGKNTISSVGGLEIPPVVRFIAGYQQGAKDANPDIKFLNAYSGEFVKTQPCKELALSQIEKGSDVVFQVAGNCGLGALEAAKEKGVWGIGVDKDQSFEGPHVLTSAVKRVDAAVFGAIKGAIDGSLAGGTDTVYGLAEDGVAIGTISPDVPQAIIDQVMAKAEEIKAGSVTIPTEVTK